MSLDKKRTFIHNRDAYLPVSTAFNLEPFAISVQDKIIMVLILLLVLISAERLFRSLFFFHIVKIYKAC